MQGWLKADGELYFCPVTWRDGVIGRSGRIVSKYAQIGQEDQKPCRTLIGFISQGKNIFLELRVLAPDSCSWEQHVYGYDSRNSTRLCLPIIDWEFEPSELGCLVTRVRVVVDGLTPVWIVGQWQTVVCDGSIGVCRDVDLVELRTDVCRMMSFFVLSRQERRWLMRYARDPLGLDADDQVEGHWLYRYDNYGQLADRKFVPGVKSKSAYWNNYPFGNLARLTIRQALRIRMGYPNEHDLWVLDQYLRNLMLSQNVSQITDFELIKILFGIEPDQWFSFRFGLVLAKLKERYGWIITSLSLVHQGQVMISVK